MSIANDFLESVESCILKNYSVLKTLGKSVRRKSDDSPISQADVLVNDLVQAKMRVFFPDHGLVSEEGGLDSEVGSDRSGNIVFLDPIDGTENFIVGFPMWAVGISVFSDSKHQGSMIIAPDLNKTAYSSRFEPGFVDTDSQLVGLSSNRKRQELNPDDEVEKRITGCSLLNLLFVAEGVFKSYENQVGANCWDILPGLQIALHAGVRDIVVDGIPYHGQMLPPTKKYTLRLARK